MDKKNLIIAVLVGLLVFGSLWGQVGNKKSKALRHELEQAEEQLSTVEAANIQAHDAVLTKTADLQKTLQGKEKQLTRARKELVSLRKANKGLEAKLSERDATVQKLVNEKTQLAAEAQTADSDQVADLKKQIIALQEALKKKRSQQSTRTQNAVIVQLADAQKKVIALQKELKKKDKQLAQKKSVTGTEQVSELQKEMNALQTELKKKDEQLAHAQSSAANQIAALEEKLTALQGASQEKDRQVAGVQEGVTPIQFAFFQAELKKKDKQLAHALSTVADLQKELTALHVELEKKAEDATKGQSPGADQVAELQKKIAVLQAELEKKGGQSGLKQFVRMQDHEANQDAGLEKELTALQAELKKKDERLAQEQSDSANLIVSLQKELRAREAELKTKNEQMAELVQDQVSEQIINQLQETMAALRGELERKNEAFEKARKAWADQVTDLRSKLTDLMKEVTSRGEYIATLQKELQGRSPVEKKEIKETEATTGQDVVELQKSLAAAKARNQELAQAVKSARQSKQGQAANSHELETAKAQIIGLEKIVEEKNAVIEEISRTLDRVKINMDVLLNKIADQQDGLQEVQEANRELVKELTAKNEELADLQEQLQAVPAQ